MDNETIAFIITVANKIYIFTYSAFCLCDEITTKYKITTNSSIFEQLENALQSSFFCS